MKRTKNNQLILTNQITLKFMVIEGLGDLPENTLESFKYCLKIKLVLTKQMSYLPRT